MVNEARHRGGRLSSLFLLWACLSCGEDIEKTLLEPHQRVPIQSEEKQELEENEYYALKDPSDFVLGVPPLVTLKIYENSSFSTLTHFELQTDFSQVSDIHWHVEGGRFHILDDELQLFSQAYPFQKSILFREKKKYQVRAEVLLNNGQVIEKISEIDLSEFSQNIFSSSVLMVEPSYASVNEPIKVWHNEEAFYDSEHVWKIKKMSFRECPKDIYEVEIQKNPHAKIIFQKICDTIYEETLEAGVDYVQLNKRNSADFIFHSPGKYEVSVIKKGKHGEVLDMARRQLTVGNTLVSRRGR